MSRRFERWRTNRNQPTVLEGAHGAKSGARLAPLKPPTLAEMRAESRRATQTQDCGTCGQPKGQRCVSGNGKPVSPHFWRLVRLRKAEGRS